MTDLSPEVVGRCVQLVRDLAASETRGCYAVEARAIAILLPDPDLTEARQIVFEVMMRLGASAEQIAAGDIVEGKRDDAIIVHVAREAIKRGRALQQQENARG